MSAAFRHFVEMLMLILQPFIWLMLCVGFVLASAHLLTMLGTRWGDRRVSSKSLLFSVGIHLSIGAAVVATIPEYRNHIFSLATGIEPVEVNIQLEPQGGGPVADGVRSGNLPAWDVIPATAPIDRERVPLSDVPPLPTAAPIARPEVATPLPDFRPVESAPPLEPQRPEVTPPLAMAPTELVRSPEVAPVTLTPPPPVTVSEGSGSTTGRAEPGFGMPVRERAGAGPSTSTTTTVGRPFAPAGSSGPTGERMLGPATSPLGEEPLSTQPSSVVETPSLARIEQMTPDAGSPSAPGLFPATPREAEPSPPPPGAPAGPAMTPGRPGGRDPRTLLRGNAESPYAIEVWVVAGGKYEPRPFFYEDGRAFVSIGHDELYAIHIINESEYDSGVSIFIDGTNMFAYSEVKGYNSLVLTKEMRSALIRGWHINNEASDAFQISDYENRLPQANTSKEFGTITVTFSAAWAPNEAPPPDEQAYQRGVRGGGLTTGRGPSVSQRYREINRHIGAVRSTLTVYYRKSPK